MKTHSFSLRRGGASGARQAGRPMLALAGPQQRQARQPATGNRPAKPTVTVIMPALNEADSIGWVVENLPGWVDELVLVDGQSIDHTLPPAPPPDPGTTVVPHPPNGHSPALPP